MMSRFHARTASTCRVLALSGLVALVGCTTTPAPRYYTLDMAPSGTVTPDCDFVVARIRATEPLARRDILVKKTPTEIEYYALEQWAADPGLLVSEKLAAELGHRPDAAKTIAVSGEVLAFEQVDRQSGVEAHLKLYLEFRTAEQRPLDEPAMKRTYELYLPVQTPPPAGVVLALSKGLEQIAAAVAADAAKL